MTNVNNLSTRVFRKELAAMSAYHVADASGMIKLDAMENPYSWPEDLKTLWLEELRVCALNRYPDPGAHRLAAAIRQVNKLAEDAPLLFGNGSDEIIQLLQMALPPGATVMSPEPGFVMYKQIAQSLGLNYVSVSLQPDSFALDVPAMMETIDRFRPELIFLAYPNNPTGNLFADGAIDAILAQAPGLVVIDEAYEPFAGSTYLPRLADYPNLLVMRTVSKLGLAGLRLGYLCGSADLINELDKIRLPYNINILTQKSAEFALRHNTLFASQTQEIIGERNRVFVELKQLEGIEPYSSAANFILFKTPLGRAGELFVALKNKGILIKNLSAQNGLLADCLRVTIGKPHENRAFLSALNQSLKSSL